MFRNSTILARLLLGLVGVTLPVVGAQPGDEAGVLDRWFAQRAQLKTWSAEVHQTRTLPTLAQPLVSTGQVWFASPTRFRWELGRPPRTIAVRDESALTIHYPRLNRAERYAFDPSADAPWDDALALIEAGFPEDRAAFEAQFELVAVESGSETLRLRLRPVQAAARRWVRGIALDLHPDSLHVQGTEIEFVNGATLRNAFVNPTLNPPIDPDRFRLVLPSDVEWTVPGQGR